MRDAELQGQLNWVTPPPATSAPETLANPVPSGWTLYNSCTPGVSSSATYAIRELSGAQLFENAGVSCLTWPGAETGDTWMFALPSGATMNSLVLWSMVYTILALSG